MIGPDERDPGAEPARERPLRLSLSGSHVRTVLAAAVGALLAGAYAHFIGCRTGTCLITSSVWTAATYGGFVGAVVGWPARPRRARSAAQSASAPGYRRGSAWK